MIMFCLFERFKFHYIGFEKWVYDEKQKKNIVIVDYQNNINI